MSRGTVLAAALLSAASLQAAERYFDFSGAKLNEMPAGFRSAVSGEGQPGEWKVIEDKTGSSLAPPDAASTVSTRRQVLAQVSRDATDEHFPLLIFDDQVFDDFTLATRFKTVEGVKEQMAGIAFRIQDETNYYVVRASSLGNTFRFYKFVNGIRSTPVGPDIPIPKGVWHDLRLECKGNQVRCFLDGKQAIPDITDTSFTEGRIGFWSKSDSVSYFADTKIEYAPREILAKLLLRQTLEKYPRLLGLKIYGVTSQRKELHMVASDDARELGRPATKVEEDVVARDVPYCGRGKTETLVTLPLHDRNGEAIAAVRLVLQPFPGQTEQTALARAMPIVKEMEHRVRSARDLTR